MSHSEKRKRPEIGLKARKRTARSRGVKQPRRGPAVRDEALRWKEVPISKLLDDAEGFFGLEELSDVEVLQDPNGKGVFFKASVEKSDLQHASEADHIQEWSGFDEDDDQQTDTNTQIANLDGRQSSRDVNGLKDSDDQLQASRTRTGAESLDELARYTVLEVEASETEVDMSAWASLNLSSSIINALSALRYTSPTAIQQLALPQAMNGKDVVGKAVTGSGKTLAFGIPIIETWLELKDNDIKSATGKSPSALILAPTRELAHQISKHLTTLCDGLDVSPRLVTVTGGLSILKQQRQLETADIIVGTPGRLWEVISESTGLLEKLKRLRFLVVDEADRLLSEGHFREVEDILDALGRKVVEVDGPSQVDEAEQHPIQSRQTLVFSATFHKGLQQKLTAKTKKRNDKDSNLLSDKQSMEYLMHKLPFQEGQKPTFVDANPESQMAKNLTETLLECKAMEKDLYLYSFLLQDQNSRNKIPRIQQHGTSLGAMARILVFTNSVSAVKRLVPLLQSLSLPSTSVSPLHSNMPQKSRLRSLERFSGTTEGAAVPSTAILVATDVAARGLDIKGITTIIHYHVPRSADTYVHRSGRTARVDASGNSILICSPDEAASVTKLIAKVHTSSGTKSTKELSNIVDRMYLPNDLLRQVKTRVELAQNLVDATQSTEKVRSEDNWLRSAAEDLGVDYDSDEFEIASKQGRRGRGGEKDRRQKKAAKQGNTQNKSAQWRAQLREELLKRIDFDNATMRNMKYLAGGAIDVDKMLAERLQT